MNSDIQLHLNNVKSNLTNILGYLGESATKSRMEISSYWPWMGKVIIAYPESFLDYISLFFRTLRIGVPEEGKEQLIVNTLKSLKTYKGAVKYELLASRAKQLSSEFQLLNGLKLYIWSNKEISKQSEIICDWASDLDTVRSAIQPKDLFELLNSSNAEESIKKLSDKIEARLVFIPALIEASKQEAQVYFERKGPHSEMFGDDLKFKESDSPLGYFVRDPARKEIEALYLQVSKAASVWNGLKDTSAIKEKYNSKINKMRKYFNTIIDDLGPAPDVINGKAYLDLFKDSPFLKKKK